MVESEYYGVNIDKDNSLIVARSILLSERSNYSIESLLTYFIILIAPLEVKRLLAAFKIYGYIFCKV